MKRIALGLLAIPLLLPRPLHSCSICGGDFQNRPTLRQEVSGSRVVVYGTLSNARLNPDSPGGEGQTDLRVEQVLKGERLVSQASVITLPRYYPGDGKGPTRGVFFFDVRAGKLNLISGRTARGAEFTAYLKAVAVIDESDRQRTLEFFLRRLDDADPDIAADAFVEVARSSDSDVALAARTVPAERLRRLLTSPQTPRERIGLIAFLLACNGTARDADLMREMLRAVPEDRQSMRRGLLCGYIVLKPREGWDMTLGLLADSKRGFLERNAALGVLAFFHNWKPEENRALILKGMRSAIEAGDLCDLAVEDLRRWGWWELIDVAMAQFNRNSHDSAIVRRAILRYALSSRQPAAERFVAETRRREPQLVADAIESLEAEKNGPR